tara:strand:+ start:8463 stop:9689 length:1227 start_codon:yes stop_codon:yes gene_type:complete
MKIYKEDNVVLAAEKRTERLFNEFPNVIVSFSGGKDSTVTLAVAYKVAKKLNRLPLKVMWLDQEAEWQSTADYVERIFSNPDFEPIWFQMPMKWNNNLSSDSKYLNIWEDGVKHIREKSPISIKENKYLDFGFNEMFNRILQVDYPETKTCFLAGVRAEEAPKRLMSLTGRFSYKDITWAKKITPDLHYTFYPIYDWSYTDIWKYINEQKLDYNILYNELYRKGATLKEMRVSSVHHETSLKALLQVQEIEPKTWAKITERHNGINTVKHLKKDFYKCPKEYPYMFESWKDYAMHLAKNLITEEGNYEKLIKRINTNIYLDNETTGKRFWNVIINTILSHDMDFTKLGNLLVGGEIDTFRRMHKNPDGDMDKFKWIPAMLKSNKYLSGDQKIKLAQYFQDEKHKRTNK